MARPKKKHEGFEPENNQSQQKRILGGKLKIHSDCFKLEVAACSVDKSWTKIPELYEQEHCHWFHTFDSDGKKQFKTNSVSGHFHLIEFEEGHEGDAAKIISVSGPMCEVLREVDGRMKKVIEPVKAKLKDDHTHKITYIKSSVVEQRSVNMISINAAAEEANKTSPVAGVAMG